MFTITFYVLTKKTRSILSFHIYIYITTNQSINPNIQVQWQVVDVIKWEPPNKAGNCWKGKKEKKKRKETRDSLALQSSTSTAKAWTY